MTSPRRHFSGVSPLSPKSPFSPINENEKIFQLTMEDVEANRTIIPMTEVSLRGQNRFISQPTSPCSVPRPSSLYSSSLNSSSMYSPSSGSVSGPGTPIKTMKHYEESLKNVKKENFNLKMKIFFLEERLANGNQNSNVDLINANAELKIQNGSLKKDLNDKLNLLLEAREAIEGLDSKVKNQEERHKHEINELENRLADKEIHEIDSNRQKNKSVKQSKTKARHTFEKSSIFSANDRSTESLVLEVLEELEEFTEREKNFENKYVKTISELKSEAFKTEEELSKIKNKMLTYEEEIESLNANLDAKNDFISALQDEIKEKKNDTKCFLSQLDNRASVIKLMEQELNSLRYKSRFGKRKSMSHKGVGTDFDVFDKVKHLEDVILFKNQELSEFSEDLRARDEKISMLENIWFRARENISRQDDVEGMWRRRLEDLTNTNNNLNDQVKMQIYERKLLLKKIRMLNENKIIVSQRLI